MAKNRELRLELLLGRHVRDSRGDVVGRLEEFRATREHDAWVVTEFDIGRTALLERLAIRHFGWVPRNGRIGYRARWDQLDLTDPDHPRLTCSLDDLEPLRPR